MLINGKKVTASDIEKMVYKNTPYDAQEKLDKTQHMSNRQKWVIINELTKEKA